MAKQIEYKSFSNLKILESGTPKIGMQYEVFEVTDEDKEARTYQGHVLATYPRKELAIAYADGVNLMAHRAFVQMLKNVRGDRSPDDKEPKERRID